MARLVAYVANRTDRLEAALLNERSALAPPADAPSSEPGAWGLAFYQGDEILHKKRPLNSGERVAWEEVAGRVQSDCVVLHLRQPTVGDFRTENTHPFRMRQWTFAHQGTIVGFDRMREALVGELPDFLRRNITGNTDSEAFFHRILAALHSRGQLDGHGDGPARDDAVCAAIHEAANEVEQWSAMGATDGDDRDASSTTLVITDGRTVYALRRGRPLYYVERRGPLDGEPTASGGARETILRYVMLATISTPEQAAAHGFQPVPEGAIAVVGRDLSVTIARP